MNEDSDVFPPSTLQQAARNLDNDRSALDRELRQRPRELQQSQRDELDRVSEQAQPQPPPLYQELLEFAQYGYLVTDLQGVIREANFAAARLLDVRKEFLPGKPLGFYVVERARPAFYLTLAQLARGSGSVHGWEFGLRLPHGASLHVEASVLVEPGPRGSAVRWLLRDVTARVLSESALQSERAFAEGLLESAQAIVLVLDVDGKMLRANAFAYQASGRASYELPGRPWSELLPAQEHDQAQALLVEARRTSAGVRHVGKLQPRTGPLRSIAWSAKLLHGAGEQGVILLLGHDITELEQAQQQALQAERLATIGRFVTNLAHESRNALQRSQACLERLTWRLEGKPEELELVMRARAAQADLLQLFEEIRTFAAPLRLDVAPCNLSAVWRETWEQVRAVFPERPAELEAAIGALDVWCSADRFRLTQVFRNVFENAFVACPAAVHIMIAVDDESLNGRAALRVAVRDNGPGLGPGPHERLFEPFYSTRPRGSGLGLAIARRIVEAHGGRIGAGNRPEGGAEIVITLPRRPS